ncbi:MAG: lipid-A-disaccharide synthase [Sutterella wadsworthensis]|nr:lipid-A-disaccharide synthase [Sutterella wadsworthensis]
MGIQSSIPTLERNGAVWLAGEASGDFIASLVIPEVAKRMDGAPQYGVGGDKMRAAGFRAWYDVRELSVRGYIEVLTHLPRLLSFRKDLITRFGDSMPQVFVGVDAPDFNLSVEEKLRRRGIPTVHFVSPSIWAWRPERIQNIRRAVDHMLLVFPFEEEIYRKAGIPATFVGHPLAGIIPMEPDTMGARQHFGLPDDGLPVITVMPGSRVDEVKGCGPVFFEAVERLLHRQGDAHVLIPAIDEQARNNILCVASLYPRLAQAMQVVVGESHRTMEAADAVLVASGTAALECALFKKPMVVGYKMPAITGMIMQKKALIHCVSLPNILLGENVVPEFLQFFCEPDAISYALEDAINNEARRKMLVERFSAMHESLLADTANLAADVIVGMARH